LNANNPYAFSPNHSNYEPYDDPGYHSDGPYDEESNSNYTQSPPRSPLADNDNNDKNNNTIRIFHEFLNGTVLNSICMFFNNHNLNRYTMQQKRTSNPGRLTTATT